MSNKIKSVEVNVFLFNLTIRTGTQDENAKQSGGFGVTYIT